ncbi:hypothetical protein CERZMDRAFT_102539 [Cercospora zeae-maydis SCOH1-5]|uniref:Uncharacterized protein n=1 Tax=Cercospora zeae-maydis SCOH1-5 TaxID=717836 RepID=A0A6A6F1S7_9PEZI|nr:hypothetical protein CERZMDRAFT_102539 [Cercospora zeae-maydis SCOH1-5]
MAFFPPTSDVDNNDRLQNTVWHCRNVPVYGAIDPVKEASLDWTKKSSLPIADNKETKIVNLEFAHDIHAWTGSI